MPVLPIDDFGQRIQVLLPGTPQAVTIDAASRTSLPFGADTTVIRLVATSACFLAFGPAPVATAGDHYLPAGVPEYFRVVPGMAVAVVRAGTDGTLHLSEML
ncbi:hypothetical protein [Azospirillum thermophilum]|uniref:Uncharacterized protein n=1 Tax=Azospirillum thermophilum TaxID=2202148 RepID=A0A2S2D0E6_9PROT|nr:hypothetical protein [Azospirillum thermophilum]AWK90165.1 hypothetical protein DEW08_29570 [Azospirillum thermophilum]